MSLSQWKFVLLMVFIPVFCFLFYHDLYLFTVDGMAGTVEKAVRSAIIKNRRTDLELSHVSDYHCPLVFGQRDEEVRIRNCSASAVFTNGTSAEVSSKQKEFRKKYYSHGREEMQSYKIIFTVTIHGRGPDFQGEATISKLF